jgi:hypothetical protein
MYAWLINTYKINDQHICVCVTFYYYLTRNKNKKVFVGAKTLMWKQEPKDQCISARVKGKKWK